MEMTARTEKKVQHRKAEKVERGGQLGPGEEGPDMRQVSREGEETTTARAKAQLRAIQKLQAFAPRPRHPWRRSTRQ